MDLVDLAQGLEILVGAVALFVGWKALRISHLVQQDSRRERERADARERLMWMQTLLNELDPLTQARAAEDRQKYEDRQRWMLTALSAGALRETLPTVRSLAERPFGSWSGFDDFRERARQELHRAIEHSAARLYAGERLELMTPDPQ